MATFSYTALSPDGSTSTGNVTADSRVAAISSIEAMGLFPTQVVAASGSSSDKSITSWLKGLASSDKATTEQTVSDPARLRMRPQMVLNFIRQLSNLLAAGVPLSRAMQVLEDQAANPRMASMCKNIHEYIADGESLADAMSRFRKVFPEIYVAMVRAGEAGGFLDVVLQQIASFMVRERELKSRVISAMVYPCVLAVVASGVVIFLLIWFIPRFSEIFADFGETLPLLTRIVQAASLGIRDYGPFVVVGLVIVVFAAQRIFKSESGRRWRDAQLPKVPVLGPVITRFALVRFTRMLGTLVGAGVPLITSLRVAREAVGNQVLADALSQTISDVQEGKSLASSLANCPQMFDGLTIEMTAVAEEAGKVDSELVRMADELEDDLDRKLRMLVALAEPAMLFVMAAMVGTIVIGMLLPVFDLWDAIE